MVYLSNIFRRKRRRKKPITKTASARFPKCEEYNTKDPPPIIHRVGSGRELAYPLAGGGGRSDRNEREKRLPVRGCVDRESKELI
jgi:hypothetical protein